uniref:Uncharacterized protein n=1 Tax=Oxyrrhis marina TaxID=2969 RepID=A0A7S4GPR0_OXYMA
MSPQVVDCLESNRACGSSIHDLYVEMYQKSGKTESEAQASAANVQAEIDAFCSCTMNCLNFVDVGSTNCMDQLPPRPQTNQPGRRLEEDLQDLKLKMAFEQAMDTGRRLSATTGYDATQCLTCMQIEESHESICFYLGMFMCVVPGVALMVTACCERGGVRMHSKGFMCCALITDIVAGCLLIAGFSWATYASMYTQSTCDAAAFETQAAALAKSTFSSDGDDTTMMVAHAFVSLLVPVADRTCELAPRFWLTSIAQLLGMLCAFTAFMGTLCICCSCTDDGSMSDSDDEHRLVKQHLNDYDSD